MATIKLIDTGGKEVEVDIRTEIINKALPRIKTGFASHKELREEFRRCPICNSNINDRTISFYAELFKDLYKIYKWLKEQGKHEFKMGEVKGFISKISYTRLSDLRRAGAGGLLYYPNTGKKPNSGEYGMNMERAWSFFIGEKAIPQQLTLNQITNKVEEISKPITINEIAGLREYLDADGVFDYAKRQEELI